MTEKALKILISALMKEFVVNSVEELLILLAQKGIHITIQVATDLYYNYQWSHRKEIQYLPLKDPNIKIAPASDVKRNEINKYC